MSKSGNAIAFICDSCGAEFDPRSPVTLCPKCGGLLELTYDLNGLKRSAHLFDEYVRDSIWRYRDFFPAVEDRNISTLGEGGSPLIKSAHLGQRYGIENLYFKYDGLMPTGSFKDRSFSLAVSYAKEIGVPRGLTYSTGNAASSFSAYCSRINFPGMVVMEDIASPVKKSMALLYGGTAIELRNECFAQVETMLNKAVLELGCHVFVNFINPLRHEALKTYAYEVTGELGRVPDYSFHPTATGGGIWGAWKGFNELANIGVTDRLPKMVGVQPESVCWLKRTIDSGGDYCHPYDDHTGTDAQSIDLSSPLQGGRRQLKAVRDSGGMAMSVTEEEIRQAMKDLGREGISAEPASASSVAAFKKAAEAGTIRSDETVVCSITGIALKQPAVLKSIFPKPEHSINADIDELRALMQKLGIL